MIKCPACDNKISVYRVRKKFYCNSCKSQLEITNDTLATVLASIVAITVSVSGYYADLSAAFAIDILLGPFAGICLYSVLINIQVSRK